MWSPDLELKVNLSFKKDYISHLNKSLLPFPTNLSSFQSIGQTRDKVLGCMHRLMACVLEIGKQYPGKHTQPVINYN